MKAKIGMLFVAAVMILAGAGAAYAHWQETLYIDVTVFSGEVDVEWSFIYTNDPCDPTTDDPGLINIVEETYDGGSYVDVYAREGDYTTYDKNVACVDMSITNDYPDLDTGTEQNNKIWIVINPVYPSYAPVIQFNAQNIGTIPVHIDDFIIEYDEDNDGDVDYTGSEAAKQMDLDGMELIAWEITINDNHEYGESKGTYQNLPIVVDTEDVGIMLFNNLLGYIMNGDNVQLHENDWIDIHLIFHFQQHMAENDVFSFHMQAQFTQWNLAGDYPGP